jgi:hypothetical protein
MTSVKEQNKGLAAKIAKLIANKRDHVKMMSGGDVTCIHVKLLEEVLTALRREPATEAVRNEVLHLHEYKT